MFGLQPRGPLRLHSGALQLVGRARLLPPPGANLSDADLGGAYLNSVKGVTDEQLEKQTKTLEGTPMRDRSIHE
jgi:hypothetical protein